MVLLAHHLLSTLISIGKDLLRSSSVHGWILAGHSSSILTYQIAPRKYGLLILRMQLIVRDRLLSFLNIKLTLVPLSQGLAPVLQLGDQRLRFFRNEALLWMLEVLRMIFLCFALKARTLGIHDFRLLLLFALRRQSTRLVETLLVDACIGYLPFSIAIAARVELLDAHLLILLLLLFILRNVWVWMASITQKLLLIVGLRLLAVSKSAVEARYYILARCLNLLSLLLRKLNLACVIVEVVGLLLIATMICQESHIALGELSRILLVLYLVPLLKRSIRNCLKHSEVTLFQFLRAVFLERGSGWTGSYH